MQSIQKVSQELLGIVLKAASETRGKGGNGSFEAICAGTPDRVPKFRLYTLVSVHSAASPAAAECRVESHAGDLKLSMAFNLGRLWLTAS